MDVKDRLTRLSPEKRALLVSRLNQSRNNSAPETTAAAQIPIDPANWYQPFPLTDLQQAYWIGRSGIFEMGDVASHSYLEFESKNVDLVRLNSAWQRLIARHDMLRLIISSEGRQQVLESVPPYQIVCADLRGKAHNDVLDQLNKTRDELSHQVLQTDKWPLFDIRAALLDNNVVRIFVSIDALIVDAWSMNLLFREWSHFYHTPEIPLPALQLAFRDYVLAEAAQKKSEAWHRAKAYWTKRIGVLPPAPELPVAKTPNALKNPRFVRRIARLPQEAWSRLKARAAKASIGAPGVLMAAYAEVLALWSKSPQFTINVPRFNRLPVHPQINDLVGEFASFTLLEVDNSKPGSFEERARRLQEQLWRDLNYSEFSGLEVLREMAQAQGINSGVLMPVVFTSLAQDNRAPENAKPSSPLIPGELVYSINQTSQVWLDNHVSERDGALVCEWDSVDEIFPEGLSQEMLDAYLRLLHRLATNEEAWQEICQITARSLMPPAQLHLRSLVNSQEAAIPEILAQDLFVEQAQASPQQIAVITQVKTLTYGELYKLSNQIGRHLRELGARPNTVIAVAMEKGWEQLAAVLGIVQSGAAYLPIDIEIPKERLWYILKHSDAKLVLTQSWLDQQLEWPQDVSRILVDNKDWSPFDPSPLPRVQSPDDLAYVLFTSGSTGAPKGVMIAHQGVVNAISQTNQYFNIGPADRILALTALHHDMSVFDIFGMLGAGGAIIVPQASGRRDPAHWSELMVKHQATLWNSVPAMMEMMLEYASGKPETMPQGLRIAFLGGDWINVTLPDRLTALVPSAKVVSVGGPTETTLWNIWYPVEKVDPSWKSIPYGRPIANTKYYVLNESLENCPTWVPGELCCAGVGVAKGYWKDEEKTRAKFLVHPKSGERIYRTGDVGRYLPDGNIEFIGRVDFQVKIQGQRIELGEIESALQQHPSVRHAVVSAVGEKQGKKRLVAYIVPQDESATVNGELREYLQQKLPSYMVPSAFVKLKQLPLTANGKINRMALPELSETPEIGHADQGGKQTNKEGLAERISRIVGKVLEVSNIDFETNLLSYGANSIDMVRIGNQLEKEFGFRPRMDQLFRLQTVTALSEYYRQHQKDKKLSSEKVEQIIEPDAKSLTSSYRVLLDPAEREAFKKSQPGLRRDDAGRQFVELTKPEITEGLIQQYKERRSHRKFALKPISHAQFSKFLSCLYQVVVDNKPKYLYASPGGLYPGQIYLHVKPGRVDGVGAGIYYYHPVSHRLVVLTPNVEVDRGIHIPFINTPIFDEAAFSIFQIVPLRAIAPSYGERSIHFATLEAGLIAHLLETSARACGLGLCQIGGIDFDKIRNHFALDKDHILIHSLLGGIPDSSEDIPEEDTKIEGSSEGNKAAKILERIRQLSKDEVKALLNANKTLSKK